MPLVPLNKKPLMRGRRYNPLAYVRGGAPLNVARATQNKGYLPVRPTKPSVVPRSGLAPTRPQGSIASPGIDPLMAQANQTIFGLVNPLMQRLAAARVQAEASARAQSGAHASALEGALGATAAPVASAFDRGIQSAATVNEAVANRLGAVGQAEHESLAAKLAQISANPQDLAGQYRGAANAEFAHGSADLSHLIGRRAEAQAYTGKLPQIARLEANRDLQSALGDIRGRYNEQEVELQNNALNQSYDLWGTLRGERREDAQSRQEAKLAREEMRSNERLALQALRATAKSKEDERRYDAMLTMQERQWDLEDAAADREFEAWQTEFNASSKPPKFPKVTGPANQKFISVNGRKVRNPNYVPPSKGGAASGNDSWQTPGSAKRQRVITSVRDSIVNPETGQLRDKFAYSQTPDRAISNKIWSVLRLQGVDPTSAQGKKLWRDIFTALGGTPVPGGGTYKVPQFVGRNSKK